MEETHETTTMRPKAYADDEMGQMEFTSSSSMGASSTSGRRRQDQEDAAASYVLPAFATSGTAASVDERSVSSDSYQTACNENEGKGDNPPKEDAPAEEEESDSESGGYLKEACLENDDKACLLAEMDETLKEGNPDYCSRRSSDPNGCNPTQALQQEDSRRRSDLRISISPPASPRGTLDFLPKRTESFLRKHKPQSPKATRPQSPSRRRAWKDGSNWQDTAQQHNMDSDDDELLMMIAKKRAAMGDDEEEDGTTGVNHTQQNEKSKQSSSCRRRGRRISDPQDPQMPGAYSKCPGDPYQRVESFQKEAYVNLGQTSRATLLDDDDSSCCPPSPRPAKTRPSRKVSASPPRIKRNRKKKVEPEEDPDMDRKPPAKPKLVKRHTTVLCGSNHTLNSEDSCDPTPNESERKNRAKSLPGANALLLEQEGISAAPGVPLVRFRRQRTRHSSINSGRSSRTSINLTSLARSITIDSFSSDLDGSFDTSSAQMVADIAEQSVSNFVRSFQRESSIEALPIAATVAPTEEDLEGLIRARLEAELQSHLTQELSHFRQNLFQGIVRRGQLQVADPVTEAGDYGEEELGFHSSERDRTHGTLLDLFHDELEEDSEDDPSDNDEVMELEDAVPSSRPTLRLGADFRTSIRQSLRMEFGNLEEELDVEEARVVTSIHQSSGDATLSSSQDDTSYPSRPQKRPQTRQSKAKQRDQHFVFSTRGLLGWLFLVFFIGALVGAGASIWVMESI